MYQGHACRETVEGEDGDGGGSLSAGYYVDDCRGDRDREVLRESPGCYLEAKRIGVDS